VQRANRVVIVRLENRTRSQREKQGTFREAWYFKRKRKGRWFPLPTPGIHQETVPVQRTQRPHKADAKHRNRYQSSKTQNTLTEMEHQQRVNASVRK